MVPERAGNSVVGPSVADGHEELGDHQSLRRLAYMLAKRPPAIVVNPLELFVRTIEQRSVLGDPLPGLAIRNERGDRLGVVGVEIGDVVLVICRLEDDRLCTRGSR